MNFDHAKSYSENCKPHQTWARQILESTPFRADNYERIIDAGCGTGEVTNILLERFPNAKEIFAFDKAPEMIMVARERNSHPKINYGVGSVDDVQSLSSSHENSNLREFNLFTSFFALHWVQDQSKALTTVQTTLAPGGEFLLLLMVNLPPFLIEIAPNLAKIPKWTKYLVNFAPKSPFTPDWTINNKWKTEPASGYKQLCEDAGLDVISSEIIQMNYHFSDDEEFISLLKPALPHLSVIPQELEREFLAAVVEAYTKQYERDEQERLQAPIELLRVHGFKMNSNELD